MCRASRLVEQRSISTPSRHGRAKGVHRAKGHCGLPFPMSWLRVFTSANTAHLGHSVGQEREPGGIPSEKYAACRDSVSDGMRLITACFARVPQRCTSRTYMHFLLMFQEVRPISKTRNRLYLKQRLGQCYFWSFSSSLERSSRSCLAWDEASGPSRSCGVITRKTMAVSRDTHRT